MGRLAYRTTERYCWQIVRLLLATRADPSITNLTGCDAYAFALREGHGAVVRLLRPRQDLGPRDWSDENIMLVRAAGKGM